MRCFDVKWDEHGYYNYGLYSSLEAAKEAAELVANDMVNNFNQYTGQHIDSDGLWKWEENYIEVTLGAWDEYYYIYVRESDLLDEPNVNIVDIKPTITT